MSLAHSTTISPEATFRAAKSVVVPYRLWSCVNVPARPFFSGSPG